MPTSGGKTSKNGKEVKYNINIDTSKADSSLKKFKSDLKKTFDSKNIQPSLDKLNKTVNNTLNKMNNSAKKANDKFNKSFNTKGASKSLSQISAIMNKEINKIAGMTNKAQSAGNKVGSTMLKGLQRALTNVDSVGKVMVNQLSGLASSFTKIGNLFGISLTSGLKVAVGIMSTIGKMLANALAAGIRAGYALIRGAISGVTNVISTGLKGAFNVVSKLTSGISSMIKDAINQKGRIDLQVDLGSTTSGLYDRMSGNKMMGELNTLLSAIKATLPAQLGSIFSSVTLRVADFGSKLSQTALLFSQLKVVFNNITSGSSRLTKMFNTIGPLFRTKIVAVFELVKAYVKLQMATTFAPVTKVLNELIAKAKQTGTSLIDMAKNFVNSMGGISGIITKVMESFSKGISVVKVGFSRLKDGLDLVITALKPWGSALSTMFADLVMVAKPLLTPLSSLCQLFLNLVEVVGLAIQKLVDFGHALVNPIKKITSAVAQGADKLLKGCNDFVNGVKKTLKGGSSSNKNNRKNNKTNTNSTESDIKDNESALKDMENVTVTVAKATNNVNEAMKKTGESIDKNTEKLKNQAKTIKDIGDELAITSLDDDEDDNTSKKNNKKSKVSVNGKDVGGSSSTEKATNSFKRRFKDIAQEAEDTARKIQESLNTVNTDEAEQEVKDLEKELENAKKQFKSAFNIADDSNIKDKLNEIMDKLGKYSMWLGKIKNPELTIRTEKAIRNLDKFSQAAMKAKKDINQFKLSKGMISISGEEFGRLGKLQASLIAVKDGFTALKSVTKASLSFASLKKSIKDISTCEADLQKFKTKMQNIFKNMFNKAASIAKSGWNKITGIFKKGSNDSAKSVGALTSAMTSLKNALLPFLGLYAIFNFFKGCIDLGSNLAEVQNVVEVTFGSMTDQVDKWAKNAMESYGLSELAAKKLMGTYGAMAKAFGFTTEEAYKMSAQLAGLTGDVASFYNISTDEAATKLKAVFTGETEALKELGVVMTQSALDQYALANGFGKTTAKMTEQEKVALRYSFVMHQLSAANGDFARTSNSWANQVRVLQLRFESLRATIGQGLINVLLPVIKLLNILLAKLQVVANAFAKFTGALFGKAQKGSGKSTEALGVAATNMSNATDNLNASTGAATSSLGKLSNSGKKASGAIKDTAKNVKKAAKEMKGSLAGIDEINILSFDKPEDDAADSGMGDVGDLGDVGDVGVPGLDGFDMGALDDITEQVEETDQKLKELFNEMFEPFKAAWDKMSPRLLKALGAFKTQFGKTMNQLGEYLKSVWKHGGKEFVQHMAEIGLACATVALEIGTRLLKSLEKLWKYLDPSTNMNTQAMLDKLNEVSELTRDFILGLSEHFNNVMNLGGDQILMAFGDTFHKVITACADVWGTFIKALDGLIDHLDPINNELTRMFLGDIRGAIVAVGDAVLGFAGLLASIRENGGQEFINALGDLAVAIGDFGARIIELGANSLNELFRHLDPATNPIAKACIDSFTNFVEQIKNFVISLGDALELFMQSGGQEFINNMGDIILMIADLAASLGGDIIQLITGFMNSWAGHALITIAATALENISNVLSGLLELLNGPLKPLVEGFLTTLLAFAGIAVVVKKVSEFVGFIKMLSGSIQLLWGVIMANPIAAIIALLVGLAVAFVSLYNNCETFRTVVDNMWNAIKGIFEAIGNTLENVFNDIKNIFGNVIDIIVGVFTGDGKRVGEAVKDLVGNILQLFGDLLLGMADIGINLITGLAQGIWEGIKSIPTVLAGVGKFIIDFFKGLFGIHSPSTVFADIGKNIIQGLINGIKDMVSKVGDSAKKVVDTIVNKFSDVGRRIREKMNKAKDAVRDVIQKIKGLFKFEWKLPKLKLPHIEITGKWGFNPPSFPKFSVKWYRNGGLIDKPTNLGTVAGAGEAGKEVVVPLENSTFANTFAQVLGDKLSQAISVQLSNKETKNSQNNDGPRDIILKLNEREFARTTINSLNRYQKEQGRTLLKV